MTSNAPHLFCFKLPNGMTCTVDADKRELVQKSKWNWMKSRGVASYDNKQTILLHNMIAPFRRVSFLDGNKLNCQRSNLVPWNKVVSRARPNQGRPKNNICEDKKRKNWEIHRKIVVDGEKLKWSSTVGYGPRCHRSREQAKMLAEQKVADMLSLSKEDFALYVKAGQNKRTTHEIISDWDAYQGKDFDMNEYMQEGVCHKISEW